MLAELGASQRRFGGGAVRVFRSMAVLTALAVVATGCGGGGDDKATQRVGHDRGEGG